MPATQSLSHIPKKMTQDDSVYAMEYILLLVEKNFNFIEIFEFSKYLHGSIAFIKNSS